MKLILIILVFSGLIYGFIYLNNQGSFYTYNNYLNNLIKNKPKITCVEDSECHLVAPDCTPCACGVVANISWKPYCPFKKPQGINCSPCPYIDKDTVKCVDTVCKLVSE
jgi:hypothetical protein